MAGNRGKLVVKLDGKVAPVKTPAQANSLSDNHRTSATAPYASTSASG
jgi:hypothetical protein